MKNSILIIFAVFFSALVISCNKSNENNSADSLITITDDLQIEHKFEFNPKSVITLAPNLTEMVYALDAGNKLIGNTFYCNYPPDALNVEKVGDMISFDLEKIVSLNPDIIFLTVEGNTKSAYEKLIDLGLNVFVSNPRDYAGIKKSFTDMAEILNKKSLADSIIQNWDKRMSANKAKLGTDKPKAVFLVSYSPLMLAGENTFINEIMKNSGLENLANLTGMNYPIFNREEILKLNPELIITTDAETIFEKNILGLYPEWENISALENGGVITINADVYYRPGPRFIEAVEDLTNQVLRLETHLHSD